MTPIECLKMLKGKIDAAGLNKCNYAIETSDIEAINEALVIADVSESLPTKKYDIDFAGNVLAGIEISDNIPSIFGAINGYGDGIDIDKITITERQ